MGRDPYRSPMRWDATAGGGFTSPDVTPSLPLGTNTDDVAAQLADPGSMLTLTRRLLRLRRETPALSLGAYAPLDGSPGCFLFTRSHAGEGEGDLLIVALNFTDHAVKLQLDGPASALVSTDHRRTGGIDGSTTLRPFEGCVFRGTRSSPVENARSPS
jgi:alpha-glucosidase